MRCVADVHYNVVRESTAKWWQDHDDYDGPIKALQCKFCDFEVLKRYTGKPKSSKSGLGCYNRMRGQMVKHLHEEHREALAAALQPEHLSCMTSTGRLAEAAEALEADDDTNS